MSSNQKVTINEENLYDIWEIFCRRKGISKDKRLHGLHPGTLDRFDGPDFQGAEIELDCKIYRGDVELHVRSGDWYRHGHHLDKRYDSVILHLVWDIGESAAKGMRNSKGLIVPTLSLRELQPTKLSGKKIYCILPENKESLFNNALKNIALHRLLTKARKLKLQTKNFSYDQTLYMSLLRLLGVPQNQLNFERLAQIVPWETVVEIKYRHHFSLEHWLALYLKQSGLLNKELYLHSLQKYAFDMQSLLNRDGMSGEIWKFAGQRPNNSPLIRIIGLAHFIHQFPSASLYKTLCDVLSRRLTFSSLYQALYALLSPNSSNFRLPQNIISSKFWGKSLITELIGNIIVPFFYKEALSNSSTGFLFYLEEFLLSLPLTTQYSKLKQYYEWPELCTKRQQKFYINQALLALKENYCIHDECKHCPVGRILKTH
jgi:hypothetical protein